MKVLQSTVLASAVASAAIATKEAGFLPGMPAVAFLHSPGGAFAGTAVVQTSEDGTTWATAEGASAVTAPGAIQNIKLKQFVRLNCSAFTSGGIQLSVLSNVG